MQGKTVVVTGATQGIGQAWPLLAPWPVVARGAVLFDTPGRTVVLEPTELVEKTSCFRIGEDLE